MPVVVLASVALQFFCLVHMVRSGRPYWWAFIIIIGSFLGSAVYIVTQVLPDLQHHRGARRAVRSVQRALDPEREKRRIEAELARTDSIENRLRLARECLSLGDAVNAEALFASCLKGLHAQEPDILLGLAQAQFLRGDFAATRASLERLIQHNPDYRSADGHLLYARALEGLGDLASAEHEYQTLVLSFPGEEARLRYAQLLQRLRRPGDAEKLYREVIARSRVAPPHYREGNRDWIEQAEAGLRGR